MGAEGGEEVDMMRLVYSALSRTHELGRPGSTQSTINPQPKTTESKCGKSQRQSQSQCKSKCQSKCASRGPASCLLVSDLLSRYRRNKSFSQRPGWAIWAARSER